MKNNLYREQKNFHFSILLFICCYLSVFLGFYFNEDSSGSGGFIADFNNTWGYVLALQEKIFVLPSKWVLHTPLHFLIISKFNFFLESKLLLRIFYCLLCFLIPLIFYNCLKTKFTEVKKHSLLILSSSIFLLPSFRSGSIWANDHITALFFFILFILYFLKWEKDKNCFKYVVLQCIFLSLTVYTRQYYAIFFIFCLYKYFIYLQFRKFILICFLISLLTIPGFILIYYDPILLSTTFDKNLSNTILVSSSILSFYLLPFCILYFFANKIYKKVDTKIITIFFVIILFTLLLNNFFDYNYKTGGGFFIKLSYLILRNDLLSLFTSATGLTILFFLFKEKKENLLMIFLMLFAFPAYMIFQKYFEPMFIFVFFLLIKTKLTFNFFTNKNNFIFYYFYIFLYLISAIVNDRYNLTKSLL